MNISHNKTDEILSNLESSPLFALSLGSKELFHSNFLYWLINAGVLGNKEDGKEITGRELFCELIKEVSGINIIPNEKWIARREKMNFDLSLWTVKTDDNGNIIYTDKGLEEESKCLLVIENKMKSVPYVKQIVKYIHKFKEDETPRFILLTLMENFPDRKKIEEPTPEQLNEWRIKELDCKIVSYKELVKKLKANYKDIQFSKSYFKDLISDYIKFVDILSQLDNTSNESENSSMMLNLDYDVNHGFEKLRILQLVQAIRVGVLYSLISKAKEKDKEKYKDIKFHTGYGRNGGQFLEVAYVPNITGRDEETGKEIKGEEPTHYSLGIQVQGHQYAHFICPLSDSQKTSDTADKFTVHFAKSNSEFQKLMKKRNFKTKSHLHNLPFRSFGGFSFQTVEIPDDATYGFVVSQIMDDLNMLVDNFKESDLEIKMKKKRKKKS